jgi:cellulose synthase/poly-beta-1,6-N-acetylglucosamine synthase-like glycosyltransferase
MNHILFAIYLLVGPGSWLALLSALVLGHSRMKRLLERSYDPPSPAPPVTILVPAKDEAARITDCVRAALDQDYPNAHLIAIDDRSTDGTGPILDTLAAEAPTRMQVLHITADSLPEGWSGKPHALHVAMPHVRGDWLFFLDSDVVLDRQALSQMVGISVARRYDAVSVLTRLVCHRAWEALILPAAAGTWSVMHAVSMTNDDRVNVAVANGQMFLIRREAYEKVGGHTAVMHELAEDVALVRRLKRAGFRTRLLHGHHLASTRMYSSVLQMFRGWGRIFAATDNLRPWRILLTIGFLLVSGLGAYAALAFGVFALRQNGQWIWMAGALAHILLQTVYLVPVYRLSGNSAWYALLSPFTTTVVILMLLRAVQICRSRKLVWRGTEYTYRPRAVT